MKVIAKTTRPIMLVDSVTGDILEQEPTVVTWTSFFEARAGKGEIKSLANGLPDEASADEFKEFLADAENEDLAVAAYVSKFQPEEESKPKPKPKTGTQKKA